MKAWLSFLVVVWASLAAASPYARYSGDFVTKRQPVRDRCGAYATASDGETCSSLEEKWGLVREDFLRLNPSIKGECTLTVKHDYCIARPIIASRAVSPPPSLPAGSGTNCGSFYRAVSGDTCNSIASSQPKLTVEDFIRWNPTVGADCRHLLPEAFYCISQFEDLESKQTAPTTSVNISISQKPSPRPQPIQDGIADGCLSFYRAIPGDSCQVVADKHGISLANFLALNPVVGGSTCDRMLAGYHYCVSTTSA
ncbi:hypothetical protein CDD80_532 [Ophiocordyceps camponoti-rufipedis]|uniref:LysM domain-containing protein n=1 Tax=Ophiocordyceps camponoti-rufipedis TaxID=2004952 RepID=A0A2C5ZCI4_9HYPO|nr:hypothetical protein CDD80_532 [Ophiocordyceps camponoti-rufipedis]